MSCQYKDQCPSYSGWCNGPKQDFSKCVEFLVTAYENEKKRMMPNEYQKEALRTASGMSKEYPRILNGLMGLNGEAGECIDILKKHLYQGHAFDSEHMAKELGDVARYLAISAEAIGYDLETIFQMNIDKLRARYPDGFDAEHSLHRRANDI